VAEELDLAILQATREGADVSELWSKSVSRASAACARTVRRSGAFIAGYHRAGHEAYTRLAAIGRCSSITAAILCLQRPRPRSIILQLGERGAGVRHGS